MSEGILVLSLGLKWSGLTLGGFAPLTLDFGTPMYNILHLTYDIYLKKTSIYFNKCL